MQKDSVLKTLVVAALLCVVCSVLVSGSAVMLKDRQDANKELDIKKNLLLASALLKNAKASKEEIEEAYSAIEAVVVNLETGEEAQDIDPQTFDQKKASKSADMGKLIDSSDDVAGIKRRAKYAHAYKYKEDGVMKMLILPVHGKGLWSTMYGFLALDVDFQTVKGIGFYSHGETPGLGAEIDNPTWKAQWAGKKVYDDEFMVNLEVIKGSVAKSDSNFAYKIDGLSGATITSNGVTGLVKYWFGKDGFGPYLDLQRQAMLDASAGVSSNE